MPGGVRGSDGDFYFYNAGYYGRWWTATEYTESGAYLRQMHYDYDYVDEGYSVKSYGYSARCVQD